MTIGLQHHGTHSSKSAGGHFIDKSVHNSVHNYNLAGDGSTNSNSHKQALQALLDNAAPAAVHDSSDQSDAPRCHPETRIAVQGQILTWAGYGGETSIPQRILWLSGPAGAGKTAIMGTIADSLKKKGNLAAAFFFSSFSSVKERRVKDHFITTLAYQLIQHESSGRMRCLRKKVLALIEKDPSVFKKSLREQMEALVLKPMRDCHAHFKCPYSNHGLKSSCQAYSYPPAHSTLPHYECLSHFDCWSLGSPQTPGVVAVDGLDECGAIVNGSLSDPERFEAQRSREDDQTSILTVILEAMNDAAFPFQFLIASRPEPGIRGFFSTSGSGATHEIFLGDEHDPDADINLYLNSKFSQIRNRHRYHPFWPREQDIAQLVKDASGQFIYAATVIRPDPDLAVKWLKAYLRLDAIDGFGPTAAWFWRRICESSEGEANLLLDNLAALLLVSDLDTPHKASLSFYHKSFQDFLSDPRRYGSHFLHLNDEVAETWLDQQFNWVFDHKKPQVPLHLPHHLEVFLAVARPYWCALHNAPFNATPGERISLQDNVFEQGLETDVVVIITGDSGSGLVNTLLERPEVEVRAIGRFTSCTSKIQAVIANNAPARYGELNRALGGRRVVFVDTPGFDQWDLRNEEILTRITSWFRASYGPAAFLAGVLYLLPPNHSIERRLLRLLSKLCQEDLVEDGSKSTTAKTDTIRLSPVHCFSRHRTDTSRDPWELVQLIVASVQTRDMGHRIRLFQAKLSIKPRPFLQSMEGQNIRSRLRELQDRLRVLKGRTENDEAEWSELHMDLLKLLAEFPETGSGKSPAFRVRLPRWLRRLFRVVHSGN
ncbi:hypothetical protein NMY22_g14081 [Coprinellus aureogranulatus]|nr:hypothetical protein NMY22_g14081 [Coprinellus aureogranulatus]